MLGAHHQDVAAVAVGDDLILQVLRGVAAAQKPIERCPQLRPLPAQPLANARQRRRRVVHDVAAGIDLPPDVGDLALERRHLLDERAQDRQRVGEPADDAAGLLDRLEVVGQAEQAQRLERAPLDVERIEDRVQVRRRAQRESRDGRPESGCLRSSPAAPRMSSASVERLQLAQAVPAGRRDRHVGDDLDDAVEFERAKSSNHKSPITND